MTDTIGKCECINSSDKFEIDSIIANDIDELDEKLVRIVHGHKELIEFGANPDELTRRYESQKSKLKNLLIRVRNTPNCK